MPGNFGNLLDSISFLAAAPDTIEPLPVRIGPFGSAKYYYWVIAHFPIGNTITTSPGFIRDAPDSFNPEAYVLVSWGNIPGAISYDVIRTTTALYPTVPGNYLIASGATSSPVQDLGSPSFFDPNTISGLPYGGPTECRITLNNKDYDRPTLLLPCSIKVTRIVFSDGSIQTSAPGAGGAPVNSVFGRQGDVVAQTGDYTAAQVTNAVSVLGSYADPPWITSLSWSKITGVPPILTNPTTTKGDIIVNNGTTIVRLGVGFNGQVLTADASSPNGISWQNPLITSVFGRTGAVIPQTGDYNAAMVTNAVSTLGTYLDPPWITTLSWNKIIGAPTLVNSFNGRTGAVVPQAGDYTAAMVTNAISNLNVYADPGWIGSLSWSKIIGAPNFLVDPLTTKGDLLVRSGTGVNARLPVGTDGQVLTADSTTVLGVKWSVPPSAPVSSVFGRTGTVVALTGDYTAAQVTNAIDQTQSYANPSWITSLAWSKITGAPAPVTPGAPNGSIQFNNNGAFGGITGLTWDSANNRLGIGTTTPAYPLDITGNTRTTGCYYIGPGTTNLVTLCNDGSGHLLINGSPISVTPTTPAAPNEAVQWNSNGVFGGSANLIWDTANNRLGINNITPNYSLDVIGDVEINGALGVGTGPFAAFAKVLILSAASANTPTLSLADNGTYGPVLALDLNFQIGKSFANGPTANGTDYIFTNADFIIMGDPSRHSFHMKWSTGYVGILNNNAQYPLDVVGSVNSTGCYLINTHPFACSDGASGVNLTNITTINGSSVGPAPPNQSVQWNNSGAFGGSANLVWNNPNIRLGIGTSTPAYNLDVVGTTNAYVARFTNSGTFSAIIIDHTDTPGGESVLSFRSGGVESAVIEYDSDEDNLIFWTGQRDAANSTMCCDTNSFVGIGTTSPLASLHVTSGHIMVSSKNADPGTGSGLLMGFDPAVSVGEILAYDYDVRVFRELKINGNPLILNTDTPSNVGIGTTNPQSPLHVNGNNSNITISNDDSVNNYFIYRFTTDGYLYFQGNQSGFSGFIFRVNGGTNVMTINNNTNVGIGTTNPAYALDVNGPINITDTSGASYFIGGHSGMWITFNVTDPTGGSWNLIFSGGILITATHS